ncbi:uncharacterized protein LOC121739351 [Aricia agestis]|uniref:uncharacterized protein LOC121739351 n=1 Tax=Aricia agestis TaxID=91739 RepID=UPI001C20502B|nr:uncharacterized protein LOC121739351 [Aricia agestis]XP_041987690.1 uncharacterized protein LOC121739351 [Aricia agestis]
MPGHDFKSIKCEPTTKDNISQQITMDIWYHAESNLQPVTSHLLHQLHGTLEELAPAPAGPAATPVEEHLPSPTEASLATLQPAPVGNTMGSSIIDMHAKMMSATEVADSGDFVPLMPVKDELSESEQQQSSDDTSDSAPEQAVGRGSPKAWSPQDMDSALDALRTHNMTLTKASATFGIPSTTLWQRAHRLGIDTPKKDGASKSWSEDDLKGALDALRAGIISANKASKAYGIPSSTLYKIARREGIRLAAPFNAAPTAWRRADLARALAAVRAGAAVQRAASHYGIPTGTLYGRCKREGIELSRSNPTPWSEGAMEEALEAVRVGQMSINQAAIHFNLPYSSLYGRFKRCKIQPPQGIQSSSHMEFSEQMDHQFSPDMISGLDDIHRTYTLADILDVQSCTQESNDEYTVQPRTQAEHSQIVSYVQTRSPDAIDKRQVQHQQEVQSNTELQSAHAPVQSRPQAELGSYVQTRTLESIDMRDVRRELQSSEGRLQTAQAPLQSRPLVSSLGNSYVQSIDKRHDEQVQSGAEVRAFSGVHQALYALEPCGPAYCVAS